ncbi:MAG: ABC transporter ATP-binding protein/permease [Finegoldia magna]|nr:ABC transporter ATP-binding protein/permease [Finegoldia magna]
MRDIYQRSKKFIIFTVVLSIIAAIISMVTPLILSANKNNISVKLFVVIIIAMIVSTIVNLIITFVRENYSATFNYNYINELIKKYYNLKYDKAIKIEPSYLIQRIFTAVDALYLFIKSGFSAIISSTLIIIISVVIVFFIKPIFALLLLLCVPLNYYGFRFINKRLRIMTETSQKNSAVGMKDLMVMLGNTDEIKQTSDYEYIEKIIAPSLKDMYMSLASTNKFAESSSIIIDFINQLIKTSILVLISYKVAIGEYPINSVLIISITIPIMFSQISNLSRVNIDMNNLNTSLDFVKNELDKYEETSESLEIEKINTISIDNPIIYLSENSYSFNLIQTLESAKVYYLEAPSGYGKSTIFKSILKFYDCEGIKIESIDIRKLSPKTIREKIMFVSQDITILSDTLEKNVGFGMELSKKDKEFIENTGILDSIFKTKNWDSIITENGSNLSGGERQKIAVARLLIRKADVLLLDEITSSVDDETGKLIYKTIFDKFKEAIILFTSHNQNNIELADVVIDLTINNSRFDDRKIEK